jgi:hypothetical protein
MYGNPLDVTCDEAAVKHLFKHLGREQLAAVLGMIRRP